MDNNQMNNRHIATSKAKFEKILSAGHAICAPYATRSPKLHEKLEHFKQFCGERLKDLNPKLMVYGIYNAGKSTLINALLGGEFAPIGDIPTTKTVTAYNWNEYTIFDTPGINAPEKDEVLSKQQLEQSDVVLFVMDMSGAFSMGKNYRELVDIAKSRKRLLIVLNDKNGYDFKTQAAEIAKIENRVFEDFASLMEDATPEELADKFHLVSVNARRAFMARTRTDLSPEKRAVLLQASNIDVLETAIVEEYQKASGLTILAQLATRFETELSDLTLQLGKMHEDVLARRGEEALDDLHHAHDRAYDRMTDFVRDQEPSLRDTIRSILETQQDPAAAENQVQAVAEELSTKTLVRLEQELQTSSIKLESTLSSFETFTLNLKENLPKESDSMVLGDSCSIPSNPRLAQETKPTSLGLKAIGTTAALKAATPLVAKVLGKSAAKFLGRAIPYINLALIVWDIGSLLFGKSAEEKAQEAQYASLERAAEEENRRQREIARWKSEVAAAADRASRAIGNEILEWVGDALHNAFKPAFDQILETVSLNRKEESQLVQDVAALTSLKGELARFANTIA